MDRKFKVCSIVKRFPGKCGWFYVLTGMNYDDLAIEAPKWGLVPAKIHVGKTTWRKSLLPYGDGTLFVALSKKVRDAEDIKLGDEIEIEFEILGF